MARAGSGRRGDALAGGGAAAPASTGRAGMRKNGTCDRPRGGTARRIRGTRRGGAGFWPPPAPTESAPFPDGTIACRTRHDPRGLKTVPDCVGADQKNGISLQAFMKASRLMPFFGCIWPALGTSFPKVPFLGTSIWCVWAPAKGREARPGASCPESPGTRRRSLPCGATTRAWQRYAACLRRVPAGTAHAPERGGAPARRRPAASAGNATESAAGCMPDSCGRSAGPPFFGVRGPEQDSSYCRLVRFQRGPETANPGLQLEHPPRMRAMSSSVILRPDGFPATPAMVEFELSVIFHATRTGPVPPRPCGVRLLATGERDAARGIPGRRPERLTRGPWPSPG